jgi:ABC-type branched-subunit amino acid transport system substrate-binding protein
VVARKPDVISFGASSPGLCYLIIKQAYEFGFKGLLTGSAPLDVSQLKKAVPEKALDNVVIVVSGPPDIPEYTTPEEKEMKKVMVEKYGKGGQFWDMSVSDMWANGYWVAIYIQAIQKADSLDPEKVTRVIETSKFPILGREVRFGMKKEYGIGHQMFVDVPILRIVSGVLKVVGVYKASL